MSVREFAGHLGVSDRMVSKWEAGGESIRPRPLNQSALDTSLSMATAEVKARFHHICAGQDHQSSRRRPATTSRQLSEQAIHVARHPLDSKPMTLVEAGPFRPGPGRKPLWLPSFFIDIQPVANAEYARFVAATGRRPPAHWADGLYTITDDPETLDDDPVTNVGWEDVMAYAHWTAKDLPTAAQWDRAARGGEGMTVTDLWEWVRADAGPGRRGAKGAQTGGFRCVSPVPRMLALLAI